MTVVAVVLPVCALAEAVALTFDDLPLNGELPPGTTRVQLVQRTLTVLHQHHVPPVYGFVVAKWTEGSQDGADALQAWVAAGEPVGNHTYSHSDLNAETSEAFLRDVYENEPVLEILSRANDWRWFRYPYLREGDTLEKRRTVRAALKVRGYRIAQVTLDYGDYLWNTPYARCVGKGNLDAVRWLRSSYLSAAAAYIDADRQMAQLVFGHQISHVLLLHLGAFSDQILPDLLQLLRIKGLQLVTLEEAERDPVYQLDPDAASPGRNLLEQWMDVRAIKFPPVTPKPDRELEAICR
ncbi:MAG TPA: polysaccharide deacetylase family protein [Steroidobacteraceae bacterium]|nr:polysaccharide deacetylase family protein [Steroidobacteraceae bacterium]